MGNVDSPEFYGRFIPAGEVVYVAAARCRHVPGMWRERRAPLGDRRQPPHLFRSRHNARPSCARHLVLPSEFYVVLCK